MRPHDESLHGLLAVGGDAHDLEGGFVLVEKEALADRVAAGEEAFGQRAVDHHDAARVAHVLLGDRAAREDRHAQGRGIVGADPGGVGQRPSADTVVRLRLDPDRLAGADAEGRMALYAPDPAASGSSITHWDPIASPNLLMEPSLNPGNPPPGPKTWRRSVRL